jgi:hypothetical protein
MSIAAMNWAWKQQLQPAPKLVLMALADAANDYGVCWPSARTIARKCCISIRTVRRLIAELRTARLLLVESRKRGDGSCTSNQYRLAMDPTDNVTPGGTPTVTDPASELTWESDPDDTSLLTTNESSSNHYHHQKKVAIVTRAESSPGEDKSCGGFSLMYPRELSPTEIEQANELLRTLSGEMAQAVLDELVGYIESGKVRTTPNRVLRGLVKRAKEGTFKPDLALRVAKKRGQRNEAESIRSQALMRPVPPVPQHVLDNPLAKRLSEIQRRFSRPTEKKE